MSLVAMLLHTACLIVGLAVTFAINPKDNIGSKMMFSEYIKEGRVQEARSMSLVTGLPSNITSYAGFFTVNKACDSNLFFWFFPSQNNPSKDPISIWLQGGPGSSSLLGSLTENGPYNLNMGGELELRQYSWTRNSSMIFIDNPVGTGFSYANSLDCYAKEQKQVGRDVVNALKQFFEVFPEYKQNDFYVTGESFAGHFVPAVAYRIHTSAPSINLKGISIGNGWCDPANQLLYSKYAYQLGLVDADTRDRIAKHEKEARKYITQSRYKEATDEWRIILYTILYQASGFGSWYNFLYADGEPRPDIGSGSKEMRVALHTGNATWHNDGLVYDQLYEDITRSVRPWLQVLIENYKVLIYNGQLDIIVGYPLTEGYLKKLRWSRRAEYLAAERRIWRVGSDIAGYAKSAGNFTEVLVRNAGHMVPTDQPEWALDLYNRFIFDQQIGS